MAQLKNTTIEGTLQVTNGSITGSLYGTATYAKTLTNMNIGQFTNDVGYSYPASTTLTDSELSLSNEDTVAVDASSGDTQIYLPSISSTSIRKYTIKKIDSSENKVNIFGPRQDSYYESNVLLPSSGNEVIGKEDTLYINKAGNLIAVSHQGVGYPESHGEVLVYEKNNNTWQKTATITGAGAVYSDSFGYSIDINEDDNILVVSALGSKEVYIFTRSDYGWTQVDLLSGPDQTEEFGRVVKTADNGNIIVVGAPKDTYGSAYIYRRTTLNSSQWNLEATIAGSNDIDFEGDGDNFGTSISLNKNASAIAIGDRDAEKDSGIQSSGLVHIYKSGSDGWYEESVLSGSTADHSYAQFGNSLSFNDAGDMLAIGAHIDNDSVQNSYKGKVYLFRSGSNGWYEETSFASPYNYDYFGERAELNESGDKLIVTAKGGGQDGQGEATIGRVYYFSSGSSGWTENDIFSGSNDNTAFGSSLAISEDAAVVIVGSTTAKKVHIFEKSFSSIAGQSPYSLKSQYESITVQNDSSSNWFVKSSHDPAIYTTLSAVSSSLSAVSSSLSAVSSAPSTTNSSAGSGLSFENQQFIEINGEYGQLSTSYNVYILSATGDGAVTLPSAADNVGLVIKFFRIDADDNHYREVLIRPQSGETIGGHTTPATMMRAMAGTESTTGQYGQAIYTSLGQYGWALG